MSAGSNLGRRFSIGRLRVITATVAAGIAGGLFPAAARGEKISPELWNPAFQGWIGLVLWPVSMDGARVIYQDAQIGGLGFDRGSPG